jgi:hypothetical protein
MISDGLSAMLTCLTEEFERAQTFIAVITGLKCALPFSQIGDEPKR